MHVEIVTRYVTIHEDDIVRCSKINNDEKVPNLYSISSSSIYKNSSQSFHRGSDYGANTGLD